jgi:hypothetical protein
MFSLWHRFGIKIISVTVHLILSLECKEFVWTGSSRERHDHARRPRSNTAIVSFARDAEP